MACATHSVVAVDRAVTNPTRERIVMDVLIEGVALSGEPTVILHPRQQVAYHVTFIVLLDKNVQQFPCKSRAVVFGQYK